MEKKPIQNCMWIYALFYATLFVFHTESVKLLEEEKSQCPYEDTVDISNSTKFSNGSYLFQGYLIPPDLTNYYDYEIIYEDKIVPVPLHLRGCICQLTLCIKFCCHPKETKIKETRECTRESRVDLDYSPYFNITNSEGITYKRHVHKETFIQQHLPCEVGYALTEKHEWKLMENGTLILLIDGVAWDYLSKNQYCITAENFSDHYLLTPLVCYPSMDEQPANLMLDCIVMLISIPFLVATIFVYAFIRELRNLHGKCLIAYLTSMTLGDILLNTNTVMSALHIDVKETWCNIIGYCAYFFIISAFFWLSIISFDLWYNFRGTNTRVSRILQQQRYYCYSLIGWLLPATLTALTIGAQMSSLNPNLKPGIGVQLCWIDVKQWSAMIYFYGPMMIIIFFNSTMFIVTFMKIYKVQKELSRFAGREEKNRHLRGEKDDFFMFLRLFVIMGVTWVFEVLSFFIDSKIFYVTDFLNSALGFIIFILFVLKRRVIMLIRKRLCHKDNTEYESEDSSRSDCEPEEICMRNYNKDGTLQFLK